MGASNIKVVKVVKDTAQFSELETFVKRQGGYVINVTSVLNGLQVTYMI